MARGSDLPANVRNTYAAVLAEAGEPRLAWQQIEAGLGVAPLADADRYVLGRIAEQYDLRDDAIAMYRAIRRPGRRPVEPRTSPRPGTSPRSGSRRWA